MNFEKADAIIEMAVGMKSYEWNQIVTMVNRKFFEAEARVEMTQELAEGAKQLLRLESGN